MTFLKRVARALPGVEWYVQRKRRETKSWDEVSALTAAAKRLLAGQSDSSAIQASQSDRLNSIAMTVEAFAAKAGISSGELPAAVPTNAEEQLYEALPGTPYSRYAVPIEYLPSRDFQPRWGHTKPPIPQLDDWFRSKTADYLAFIELMRASVAKMGSVQIEFDEAKLPEPAWGGVPYAPFDSVALYTIVQKYKPKRYLEIGSGITTCFAFKAIKDAGLDTTVMSIDPEPRAKIDAICDEVIRDGLETCDLSIFDKLEAGDILFFDGSHRTFMNSDVTVFFIDILPRIKPGVIVHIHDIMLPYDYPDSFKHWYWNEQYMLAVYMMGNRHRIEAILPTAFICRDKAFDSALSIPLLDLGAKNDGWRGGGAMWFTHI